MVAKAHAVDFSNVKEGRRFSQPQVEEGDYKLKVISADESTTDDDTPMWTFGLQMVDRPRAVYPYRCKLVDTQAWKLRNLLVAAGKVVPKKQVKVNPNNLVGSVVGASLVDDEYEGRVRSEIDALFPVSELADEEEEVEEAPRRKPAAKKAAAKKTAKKPAPAEDEDLDEVDDEEVEDDDEDLDLDEL
jgi:hypothetical protein